MNTSRGLRLQVHLPFSQQPVPFSKLPCIVTHDRSLGERYLQALKQEWNLYRQAMDAPILLRSLTLTGPDPAFFDPSQLRAFLKSMLAGVQLHPDAYFLLKAAPRSLARTHLTQLADMGFRRLSFQVRDFDPVVQEAIGWIQPVSEVAMIHRWAQRARFESVTFSLTYGLPFQSTSSLDQTFEEVQALAPERITFSPIDSQARQQLPYPFKSEDFPTGSHLASLQQRGRAWLSKLGYRDIGMNHFARKEDPIFQARKTPTMPPVLGHLHLHLGLGAQSDLWIATGRNHSDYHGYLNLVEQGLFPLTWAHEFTAEELAARQ